MPITNRTVWYFHGFDPATTARYRRIFEAASERFDVVLEDLPDGSDGWSVTRDDRTTAIAYLRYEQLVRDYRSGSSYANAARGFVDICGYLFEGALGRIARASRRTLGLALTPFILLGMLYLAILTAFISLLVIPTKPTHQYWRHSE